MRKTRLHVSRGNGNRDGDELLYDAGGDSQTQSDVRSHEVIVNFRAQTHPGCGYGQNDCVNLHTAQIVGEYFSEGMGTCRKVDVASFVDVRHVAVEAPNDVVDDVG